MILFVAALCLIWMVLAIPATLLRLFGAIKTSWIIIFLPYILILVGLIGVVVYIGAPLLLLYAFTFIPT